jgi:hypothetical protein
VASAQQQYFTGSSNQTVVMPVTSTLALGMSFLIVNISTGTVTINSSGGNTIATLGASQTTRVTCILTSGTTAASWSAATPVAGSGVVSSGTINDLAFYSASGTTVSALATANSGYLVTSVSGVPSIGNTGGALTLPSITFNSTTGIVGTTTNDNAAALSVGEYKSTVVLVGSAVSTTNGAVTNVATLSLTAGDWDVWSTLWLAPAGGALITQMANSISQVSGTLQTTPADGGGYSQLGNISGTLAMILPCAGVRVSLSTTTNVYMVGQVSFTGGTMGLYGSINARRRR